MDNLDHHDPLSYDYMVSLKYTEKMSLYFLCCLRIIHHTTLMLNGWLKFYNQSEVSVIEKKTSSDFTSQFTNVPPTETICFIYG